MTEGKKKRKKESEERKNQARKKRKITRTHCRKCYGVRMNQRASERTKEAKKENRLRSTEFK